MDFLNQLQQAMGRRVFSPQSALRIFHGPGEGVGETKKLSVDKFGEHAWLSFEGEQISKLLAEEVTRSCQKMSFQSAALIHRQKKGEETRPPVALYGELPKAYIVENSGLKFEVNFVNQRQPGLFLDMDFVRHWLLKHVANKSVLNLFSYTGSLSVAAGAGRASKVTSVDLSRPFTEWAQRNWTLNGLPETRSDFIYGDVFEWLKKFKKQKRLFDIVVCDPPSFSRGKKSNFSTSKDLAELHQIIFEILENKGILVTSINSANLSRKDFLRDVKNGASESNRKVTILEEFSLPPEFPTPSQMPEEAYLKGFIFQDMTSL